MVYEFVFTAVGVTESGSKFSSVLHTICHALSSLIQLTVAPSWVILGISNSEIGKQAGASPGVYSKVSFGRKEDFVIEAVVKL